MEGLPWMLEEDVKRFDGGQEPQPPARSSPASATSAGSYRDSKGHPLGEVRAIRDDIASRIRALVAELDGQSASAAFRIF